MGAVKSRCSVLVTFGEKEIRGLNVCLVSGSTHTESGKLYRKVRCERSRKPLQRVGHLNRQGKKGATGALCA